MASTEIKCEYNNEVCQLFIDIEKTNKIGNLTRLYVVLITLRRAQWDGVTRIPDTRNYSNLGDITHRCVRHTDTLLDIFINKNILAWAAVKKSFKLVWRCLQLLSIESWTDAKKAFSVALSSAPVRIPSR